MERLLNNTYNLQVPIVTHLELVGGLCNLKCPLCEITMGNVKRRNTFIEIDLVRKMIKRGDFQNTFYLELQFLGEATLHPQFDEITTLFKKETNLKLGLSTNCTNWREGLRNLDFITISSDSVEYRKQRNDKVFHEVLQKILDTPAKKDIQLVELGDWQEQKEKLQEIVKEREDVLIRSVPDCSFDKNYNKKASENFCLDPFLSCSIQSDGDVVLCCFASDKELVVGNVKEHSLQEIWQREKWQQFRERWLNNNLPQKCKSCKFRSPILLFYRFILNWQLKKWI